MAAEPALTFNDVFDDDDLEEPKEAPTVHHIRANSSIMQVKKILGMMLSLCLSSSPRNPPFGFLLHPLPALC